MSGTATVADGGSSGSGSGSTGTDSSGSGAAAASLTSRRLVGRGRRGVVDERQLVVRVAYVVHVCGLLALSYARGALRSLPARGAIPMVNERGGRSGRRRPDATIDTLPGAVRLRQGSCMIRPLIDGFSLTFKHLFRRPITVDYPNQKVPMFPRYRGKQVLMRDEHGMEKCVACGLCSVACPADAIYLEAAENDGTVMAGPRYASVYQIHKTRCIFCGYCEEACPVSAIFMGKDYELPSTARTTSCGTSPSCWSRSHRAPPRRRRAADDRLRPRRAARPRQCPDAPASLPRRPALARARLRRRDGHDAVRQGIFINRCFESLNLSQPELVPGVHREYLAAGADVLETNTFGASRMKLRGFGLGDQVHAINRAGARLAREVAGDVRLRGRRHRPARRAHRALGQDRRRRGPRVLPRAGRSPGRGRRRPADPRDVPRLERGRGGGRGRPGGVRRCRSSRW